MSLKRLNLMNLIKVMNSLGTGEKKIFDIDDHPGSGA